MKILLATDGSVCAQKAAETIASLPISNPEIHILTVSFNIESVNVSNVQPWVPEWNDVEERRVTMHHARIKRIMADLTSNVETLHRHGNPTYWILEEARRIEANLIVVGSLGHSAIGRLMLGSVSDEVATHAECSVLIVRPDAEAEAVTPIRRIHLAYDASPGSEEAVEELLQHEWPPETELTIDSVVCPIRYYGEGYSQHFAELEEKELQQMREAGERLKQRLSTKLPNITVTLKRADHIGNAIIQSAEESKCDLIVVGDTGHGLLAQWFLGSTTKYILHHAPCSVWVSRHHRKAEAREPARAKGAVAPAATAS